MRFSILPSLSPWPWSPGCCFSAYGTFMLRQFLLAISQEIEEAAYIDGCSAWGVGGFSKRSRTTPGLVPVGTR